MRYCIKCEKSEQVSPIEKGRRVCKLCRSAQCKLWRETNPRTSKASYIKRDYGVSLEEYESSMLSSNVCEICGGTNKLGYDHNHDTNEFRGVLCDLCNSALGKFQDSTIVLQKAIIYLEERGSYYRPPTI